MDKGQLKLRPFSHYNLQSIVDYNATDDSLRDDATKNFIVRGSFDFDQSHLLINGPNLQRSQWEAGSISWSHYGGCRQRGEGGTDHEEGGEGDTVPPH